MDSRDCHLGVVARICGHTRPKLTVTGMDLVPLLSCANLAFVVVSRRLRPLEQGRGIASVEQLKMILSGNVSPRDVGLPSVDDDSGDSMISYDYTPSELSFNPQAQSEQIGLAVAGSKRLSLSASHGSPLSSIPSSQEAPGPHENHDEENDEVPPVPPLPSLGSLAGYRGSIQGGETEIHDHAVKHSKRNLASRGGESFRSSSVRSREASGRAMDLQELLMGIDSRSGEGSLGNVAKPPY